LISAATFVSVAGSELLGKAIESFSNKRALNLRILYESSTSIDDEFLQQMHCNHAVKLEVGSNSRKARKTKASLAVLFIENNFDVSHLFNANDQKLLIVLSKNASESVLSNLFKSFLNQSFLDVNVLTQDFMLTFMPFKPNVCGDASSQVVNRFDAKTKQWNGKIFPEKLNDFHSCPIRISTLHYPPSVRKETRADGSVFYVGSDIELIKGLSSVMNFTVNLSHVAAPYDFGVIEGNRSTGAISHIASNGSADIAMGFFFLNYEKALHLAHSYP